MKYSLYHLIPQSTALGEEARREAFGTFDTWEEVQTAFLKYLSHYGVSIDSIYVGIDYMVAEFSDGSVLEVSRKDLP